MAADTPVIPQTITVHLGRPNAAARNVTVPFTDYLKNVASSEIYPTWPENAIRANIYAQASFALNRIYTQHYRSRGYDFDITNSTAYDQAYIEGRSVFSNVAKIVDELFNNYVTKGDQVQPYFTQYCSGREVTCDGLSQWGTVTLANQGYTPYRILQYYYGNDVNIKTAPVKNIRESYPGRALRLGDISEDVRIIQRQLNRIARNYPAIPRIPSPNGIFDTATRESIRKFQSLFNLTVDGIVGKGADCSRDMQNAHIDHRLKIRRGRFAGYHYIQPAACSSAIFRADPERRCRSAALVCDSGILLLQRIIPTKTEMIYGVKQLPYIIFSF